VIGSPGSIASRLRKAVVEGDAGLAARLAGEALASGIPADRVLDDSLIAAMDEAGRRFEANEYFVPELLVSARAMKAAMEVLETALGPRRDAPAGRVAIGTVQGDLHDIGKNLVATMLRGAGFDVRDLGVDITPGQFLDAAREGADVVALSALLTTTMLSMRATVEAIERAGLRRHVRVIVGGAPVTAAFAASIGADGYADNAAGAVALARRLAGRRQGDHDQP
jgi:5-methyltetrahydrofolate--homocysteine methyltransferase